MERLSDVYNIVWDRGWEYWFGIMSLVVLWNEGQKER